MTVDLIELKALATAAVANQYDPVALNDYGTAVPPATVLGLIAEIERHRQVNAEGCKPDSSILLSSAPCAGAAPRRSLNKAEGCKPDLNTPHLDYNKTLAEVAAYYLLTEAPVNYVGKVFTISLKDDEQSFEIVVTTQRIGAKTAHELRENAENERDAAIAESERLSDLLAERNSLLDDWLQLANVCDDRNTDLMRETRNMLDEAILIDGSWTHAASDVMSERRRQLNVEGRTTKQDDAHTGGQLADAAACYALWAGGINPGNWREFWPWAPELLKQSNPRQMLVKAGALILAEIERLDRMPKGEVLA
ncbi:hypothetical protein [Pseudomonas sichuanensis]|uniref:hypothetical protein n=1 Tax=Pseudomonas sichuanensis TaxID=2213015 RepID=UPI0036F193A7